MTREHRDGSVDPDHHEQPENDQSYHSNVDWSQVTFSCVFGVGKDELYLQEAWVGLSEQADNESNTKERNETEAANTPDRDALTKVADQT